MKELFSEFSVISPTAEEMTEGDPEVVAETNAIRKGRSVTEPCDVLVASDTVVALGRRIYGKPRDEKDAVRMLCELSGKTHSVISGVYLCVHGQEESFVEESFVTMKDLTLAEIERYVQKFRPLDKAGAYGIQDDAVVEKYVGDYENVVGLPLKKTKAALERLL